MRSDAALESLARSIRALHDAVSDF
jgi:hypothetical protein